MTKDAAEKLAKLMGKRVTARVVRDGENTWGVLVCFDLGQWAMFDGEGVGHYVSEAAYRRGEVTSYIQMSQGR